MMNTTKASSLPCTCHVPLCVELNSSPTSKALLLENLRQVGWSPVQWQETHVPPPTAPTIQSLFSTTTSSHEDLYRRLHHRSQESGGKTTVEPKESLELEQSQMDSINHDDAAVVDSLEYRLVQDWCRTLSKIAQVVNQMLDIPPNILLVNDDKNKNNNKKEEHSKDRLDLLRVFYYHPVPQHPKGEELPLYFGSSPHTDWGSWTVVWQDGVGGLETYCRKCQKWIPVPPAPMSDAESTNPDTTSTNPPPPHPPSNHCYTWNCIVHVGDLASLALGKEQQQQQHSVDHFQDQASSRSNDDLHGTVQWPSPCHRVVSPTHSPRTSLVYFAYPPPHLSLLQLQEALADWKKPRGLQLPHSEYYLLQDQSSSTEKEVSNSSTSSSSSAGCHDQEQLATSSYRQLCNRSIREVIHTKWAQVQREST